MKQASGFRIASAGFMRRIQSVCPRHKLLLGKQVLPFNHCPTRFQLWVIFIPISFRAVSAQVSGGEAAVVSGKNIGLEP